MICIMMITKFLGDLTDMVSGAGVMARLEQPQQDIAMDLDNDLGNDDN